MVSWRKENLYTWLSQIQAGVLIRVFQKNRTNRKRLYNHANGFARLVYRIGAARIHVAVYRTESWRIQSLLSPRRQKPQNRGVLDAASLQSQTLGISQESH